MPSRQSLKRKRSSANQESADSIEFARHGPNIEATRTLDKSHIEPTKLKAEMQQIVTNALSGHMKKYSAVRCLFVSWEADDLNLNQELPNLSTVFKDKYGFQCENYAIPSRMSKYRLLTKINQLLATVQGDELFILYYSGHAEKPSEDGRFIWAANKDKNSPTLDWFAVQVSINEMLSDALLILDCCYAAQIFGGIVPGKKEVLAASGWDTQAFASTDDNKCSFTAFLIRHLEHFAEAGESFAIKDLYTEMMNNSTTSNGTSLHATPIHCPFQGEGSSRNIVLHPLSSLYDTAPPKKKFKRRNGKITRYPRMTIAVSFSKGFENRSVESIGRWLTSDLPEDVEEMCIDVQSAAQSNSTLVILTMPMELWNALPYHPAIRPCGIITGPNTSAIATVVQCIVTLRVFVRHWKATRLVSADIKGIEPSLVKSSLSEEAGMPDRGLSQIQPIQSDLFTYYCRENDSAAVIHLVNKLTNLDVRDESGLTGLLHAAEKGHWDLVILLVKLGALVDTQCIGHDTVLCVATRSGRADIVKMLLAHNADIELPSQKGNLESTPLYIASEGGNKETVRLLLDCGADVNAMGKTGGTALRVASGMGHREIVQLLLERGADCNTPTGSSITALYAAARKGHIDIVRLLLEHGANVNAPGGPWFGNALDVAESQGHEETARLLRAHGGNRTSP